MNWTEVEKRIQALRPELALIETRILAVLCAAYKTGADAQRIAELTGYKLGDVHDALTDLRDKMFVMGKQVAERDVLRALPGSQALLKGLLVDQLPSIESLHPVRQIQPAKIQEVESMEELCDCGRPKKHRGVCKGKNAATRKASNGVLATAVAAGISAGGVSFTIRCETDGQKYEANGSSLDAFNSAMAVVERMLGR